MNAHYTNSIWGGGQLLAFSGIDGETNYLHALKLRTIFDGYGFEIMLDDPCCANPVIRYIAGVPDKIELTGDYFRFTKGDRVSSGVFIDCCNLLFEGDFEIQNVSGVDIMQNADRWLIAAKGFLHLTEPNRDIDAEIEKRAVFLDSLFDSERIPDTQPLIKACSQLKTQIYSPEGQIKHLWSTPDRWPHKQMWLWDSVFHSIGMRHCNPKLARDLINSVFDLQQKDGFIPLCGNPYEQHHLTQPPILGLGIKLVMESEPDEVWLADLSPKLARYIEWLMKNRDSTGEGLLQWYVGMNKNCRCGESGMDNSPRFNESLQLNAIDFNSYLAFECEFLSESLSQQQEYWHNHYLRICRLINKNLWNESLGFYVDYDLEHSRQSSILSSAGFLPLYCGAATPQQAAKLVQHLTDSETFGTSFRIPSIAKNNTSDYRKDMWKGPVWINMNCMILRGLERYGYHALATSIAQETIAELEKWYYHSGTFYEFYDDRQEDEPRKLERKGRSDDGQYHPMHQVLHDFGWTAAIYIDLKKTHQELYKNDTIISKSILIS